MPLDDGARALLLARIQGWFREAAEHGRAWRREALEDYAFYAGDQWSDEDRAYLREQLRPVITFNRVAPIIDAVAGAEINNRQELRLRPREQRDGPMVELLDRATDWLRDACDAEDEESDAFLDLLIAGMGWIETRLDYERDPAGTVLMVRVDPLEMYWDPCARARNLADARFLMRVRSMPREDAQGLFPDADPALLHAGWAVDDPAELMRDALPTGRDRTRVSLVECQWWDRETQADGSLRRVHRRAFVGGDVLAVDPLPVDDHFTFTAMTGRRDRNAGTFYGLIRSMKDPQRWSNKWLSQILHIVNTTAKGKLLAEADAFVDPRRAEQDWARPEAITLLNAGALAAGKIQQLGPPPFPGQLNSLLEFGVASLREAAGVNAEMLGMADRVQPGVLEYQRRQAGVTLLAQLFNALRQYRKRQGRLLVALIARYLADGRLIRVAGDEGRDRFLPLIGVPETLAYDVVVDEAPSAPNQKDRAWAVVVGLLPLLRGAPLSPEIWAELIRLAPLPDSVGGRLAQLVAGQGQAAAPNPTAQRIAAVQLAQAEAGLRLVEAQAAEARAQAALRLEQAKKAAAEAAAAVR